MCGITGFVDGHARNAEDRGAEAQRMAAALSHRGPDDQGVWLDPALPLALAHRRLSIVDLSPHGHQPMRSADERYVLSFNGEIYNHRALRAELEAAGAAPAWRGHSDTEVMLAAFGHWGLDGALRRFNGMFAFALWDRAERRLHLGRDRLGEKPLYYGWAGGSFLFASELKALRAHRDWRGEIDRDALTLLLRHNAIPAPYSIYRGILKLPPATSLSLDLERLQSGQLPAPVAYWSLRGAVDAGRRDPLSLSDVDAAEALDALLRDAVALRMDAEVPLGAFLSGGIDSSTVVALMQAQSSRRVQTFSIGFHEPEMNEAQHAKAVAEHLGTDHHELYVTPQQAIDLIPQLPTIYDEPFADSSQLPTTLVSALARRYVTVSLSGDGGDELFGGYYRYLLGAQVWNKMRHVPRPLRRVAAEAIRAVPPARIDAFARRFGWAVPTRLNLPLLGDKLHKGADLLAAATQEGVYRELVSHWKDPAALVPGAREPQTVLTDPAWRGGDLDFVSKMMALDTISYLPDDILAKVDRATMSVSLEGRIPLLDHRVVEFAWRLPLQQKIRGETGKWLLREVLARYVPKTLTDRPKMGFGIPIGQWLRGPLRDWAEALLDPQRLAAQGYLDPAPIRQRWQQHLDRSRDWQYYLWDVLAFQAWFEHGQG